MLKEIRLIEKEKEADTVGLKINGQAVEASKGMNVVEAAKRIGVDIPVFCYHPKLSVIGACRMCLVEVEGQPKLRTACTTEVEEGMSVLTESPAAREGQWSTLEFLLINHPLDCPVCDKGGECPLQDLTYDFGPGKSRFQEPKWHFKKPVELGPNILLDRERCIMCMRCTRFCDEVAWHPQLILAGTTTGIQIATAGGLPFSSQFAGNTVEICPVGALLSKQYYLQARPWEIEPEDSICPRCSVGCNITVHTREGRIKRIISRGQLPRKNPGPIERITDSHVTLKGPRIKSTPLGMYTHGNPEIDDGWLCDRGRFGFDFVHAGRLETPIEKTADRFRPVSWDHAIETIARKLKEAKGNGGAGRIAAIGSPGVSNEGAYLFQKFFRSAIGTNHLDHHPRSEWGEVERRFGGLWDDRTSRFSIIDLDEAEAILLIGSNISEAQPVIELRVKKALRLFHARLAMAYPWECELSAHADPWLRYRPGEAVAFIKALLGRFEGKPGEMEEQAKRAGVPADGVVRMAEICGGAKRLVVLLGSEAVEGPATGPFLDAFRRMMEWRRRGDRSTSVGLLQEACNSQGAADMGVHPDFLPGYQPVEDPAARGRIGSIWGISPPPERGMSARQILEAAADGGIQALYLFGANPVIDDALGGIAAEALPKIPFVVAQDLALTETARHAQIVLPMGIWGEFEGSYTNTDRHIQRFPKVIPPAGESRPDWTPFEELGRYFGLEAASGGLTDIRKEIAAAAPLTRTGPAGDRIVVEGQWGDNNVRSQNRTGLNTI